MDGNVYCTDDFTHRYSPRSADDSEMIR
jgi:hypothetical protein